MAALSPRSDLRTLEHRAMLLVLFGTVYNVAEFVIAEGAGFIAGSIALIGFGLDSAIEVSAGVVVFVHLLRREDTEGSDWEKRIATYVGVTLIALAGVVGLRAVYDLVTRRGPTNPCPASPSR